MTAKRKSAERTQDAKSVPIVINNTDGPRYIPYGGVSDGEGGVVDLKRMKFASGFNMPADPDEFEVVRNLHSYKKWVHDGVLTEISDVAEITTVGGADKQVIEASASKVSIQHWYELEQRASVKSKLKAKLAEFKRYNTPGGD